MASTWSFERWFLQFGFIIAVAAMSQAFPLGQVGEPGNKASWKWSHFWQMGHMIHVSLVERQSMAAQSTSSSNLISCSYWARMDSSAEGERMTRVSLGLPRLLSLEGWVASPCKSHEICFVSKYTCMSIRVG